MIVRVYDLSDFYFITVLFVSKYVANFCKYSKNPFTEYELYHLVALLFYIFLRLDLLRIEMLESDVRCENLEYITIFVL